MTPPTRTMLECLQRARKQPLRRCWDGTPGQPPWPAPWQTIYALVDRGWLEATTVPKNKRGHKVTTWTITPAGREALEPTRRTYRDTVRTLNVPGGSTRPMQLGVWVEVTIPEPEPVESALIGARWTVGAWSRQVAAVDRRVAANRMRSAA